MKGFRKTALTALATAMLFSAGCRRPQAARTQQEIISDAVDYLTDKYGFIPYTIEGFVSGGGLLGTSYDTISFTDTYEDAAVSFHVHVYEDENPVRYEDSYFGLTVIDDFERLAGSEAKSTFRTANSTRPQSPMRLRTAVLTKTHPLRTGWRWTAC